MEEQDTAVWVGPAHVRPVGSSGPVREAKGGRVLVDWGDSGGEGWITEGMVCTPEEAAERDIEPFASAFRLEEAPDSGQAPST